MGACLCGMRREPPQPAHLNVSIGAAADDSDSWEEESRPPTPPPKGPVLYRYESPGEHKSAHQIIEYLYLGGHDAAKRLEALRLNRVRFVLNMSREQPNYFPGEFEYLQLATEDNLSENILRHVEIATSFIHRALAQGAGILVHCHAGMSRSACMVIAYLISYENLMLRDAYFLVKSQRFCISPNPSFMRQLAELEMKLHGPQSDYRPIMAPPADAPLPALADESSGPARASPALEGRAVAQPGSHSVSPTHDDRYVDAMHASGPKRQSVSVAPALPALSLGLAASGLVLDSVAHAPSARDSSPSAVATSHAAATGHQTRTDRTPSVHSLNATATAAAAAAASASASLAALDPALSPGERVPAVASGPGLNAGDAVHLESNEAAQHSQPPSPIAAPLVAAATVEATTPSLALDEHSVSSAAPSDPDPGPGTVRTRLGPWASPIIAAPTIDPELYRTKRFDNMFWPRVYQLLDDDFD